LHEAAALEVAYALICMVPGIPCLLYGEEIGLGDSDELPGRMSIRVPMAWDDTDGDGFTTAAQPVRPLAGVGVGGERVNVRDARDAGDGLWKAVQEMLRVRCTIPEVGLATAHVCPAPPGVLAHSCTWGERTVLGVHNLTARPAIFEIPSNGGAETLLTRRVDVGADAVELEPYGYCWMAIS